MVHSQNPNIKIESQLKSILDSKKAPGESYNDVIASLLLQKTSQSQLFSIAQTGGTSKIVGASSGEDAFNQYQKTLNWITDTKKKLPGDISEWGMGSEITGITPYQREEAFAIDPLVKGIITPYLKNIILGSYAILTDDNKKYSDMVEDIEIFLKEIQILDIARKDFENYAIKHGKSYWRKDYDASGKLRRLQILDAKSMRTYFDPWDSSIRAHHQRIYVDNVWNSQVSGSHTESNSWFIPDGETIIEEDGIGSESAYGKWNHYKAKYNISETAGLRVGDAIDIIDMHIHQENDPAPIDSAILAIWLKRLVIANAPNLIFNVLIPFMHMKMGVITESIDPQTGARIPVSSVPQKPAPDMATTNPELYTQMMTNYNNYEDAKVSNLENAMRYRGENGMLATGPEISLTPITSSSSISSSFIEMMIRQLNEDIGQSLGFPVSLVMARGAELATTRTIQDLFNTVYAGVKQDYERVFMDIIEEYFEGQTWNYEVEDRHGNIETGTYTLEDTGVQFKLGEQDKKDALVDAQTKLVTWQGIQIAKAIGASKQDVQAFLDEQEDMGLWELDNYDVVLKFQEQMQQSKLDQTEIGNISEIPNIKVGTSEGAKINKPETPGKPQLPADMEKQTVAEMIESTIKTDIQPSELPGNEDEDIKNDLFEIYKKAMEAVEGVVEEIQ